MAWRLGLLFVSVLVSSCFQQSKLETSPNPLGPTTNLGGCKMFPANNIWNTRIDSLPVGEKSADYTKSIGQSTGLHADFDAAGGGIPFNIVPENQPLKSMVFDVPEESDPGKYPVPDNAVLEGGLDNHVVVLQQGSCKLYEVGNASKNPDGSWSGFSGAVFDLNSNDLRPETWTSADAAGLPILPGLVRYEEVKSGEITHALRFTAVTTQKSFLWPARHQAGSTTNVNTPPMGARFRLKSGVDISGYGPNLQVVLTAMKRYGIILADNGSNWYVTGEPNSQWDDDEMHALANIKGWDFELVDVSGLMIDPNSGQVR